MCPNQAEAATLASQSARFVEVALAVILLATTGLAIAGLDRLLGMNPGFRPEHLRRA